jgi:hypothetical protein
MRSWRKTAIHASNAGVSCVSLLAWICAASANAGEIQLASGRELDEEFVLRFEATRTANSEAQLVVHWSDRDNYCALNFSPSGIRLQRLEAGKPAVLGETKEGLDGAAAFTLKRLRDRFVVFQEDRKILEARADAPRRGKLGVSSNGGTAKIGGLKYQALGTITYSDGFMRSAEDGDPWSVHSGTFAISAASHPDLSVSPFRYIAAAGAGAVALATHGDWFWSDYDARVALRASPVTSGETVSSYEQCRGTPHGFLTGGRLDVLNAADIPAALTATQSPVELGLAFYVEGPATYRLLRVTQSPQEAQLVEVKNGQERIVARRPVHLPPRQWFSLRVLVKSGAVRCYVDNCLAFARRLEGLVHGSMGLWARGADGKAWEAQYDDVSVSSIDAIDEKELLADADSAALKQRLELPEAGSTWVPEYFTHQPTMLAWADPRNSFVPIGAYSWYVGSLFESAELRWHSTQALKSGKWSAALSADEAAPDAANGYCVTLEVYPQGGARVAVQRNGADLGEQKIAFDAARGAQNISLCWHKGQLRLRVNGRDVAGFQDPQPFLSRARAGVSIDGEPVSPASVDVLSSHLLDETFSKAPVAWRSAAGTWEVVSRWACSPRYTWFGGKGAGSGQAVLWSKRAFGGALVLDAFVAPSMSDRFTPFYDAPMNFSLSFCADGSALFSGYSFLFGFQDEPARLYRKERLVAESREFCDPELRSGIHPIFQKIHQRWYHVRVERRGALLRCFVDGRKLVEFNDPEPLESGHAALWTTGSNGFMLARLRAAFEKDGVPSTPFTGAEPKLGTVPPGNWTDLGADLSGPAVRLEPDSGKDSPPGAVRAVNLRSGGNFAFAARLKDVDAVKLPYLSFQYRINPGARINAYIQCRSMLWRVALSGPVRDTAHSLPLWKAEDARDDGAWRQATIPLLDALRIHFPAEAALPIDAVVFGNYEEDDALSAGRGGNLPGASYSVAPVAFAERTTGLVQPEAPGADDALKPAITLPEAPLIDCNFDREMGRVESFDGLEGVWLFRELRSGTSSDRCLRVSAKAMGGCFGLFLRRQPFDVRKYPLLEFDICIEPGTQVNLQMRSGERRFEWTLTDQTPAWQIAGDAGVSDDGRWHHVCIDLRGPLRGGSPLDFLVRDLALADAEFAGNVGRSCYRLDNLRLSAVQPVLETLKVAWAAPGAAACVMSLDQRPEAIPQGEAVREAERSFAAPTAGVNWLHACAVDAAGKRGPLLHLPVVCRRTEDRTPPLAESPFPPPGARTCTRVLKARLSDEGDGISLQDIVFEVNGVACRAGEGRMAYDPRTQEVRLRLPLQADRSAFDAGQQVHVEVKARDLAGNPLAKPLAWDFTFDPAAWTENPPAPYVVYIPGDRVCFEDFEAGMGPARNRRGTVVSHESEAAIGGGSLGVTNRLNRDFFQATLLGQRFDASLHPIISFDLQPVNANDFSLMLIIKNRFHMLTLIGEQYDTNSDWESLGRQDIAWSPGRWTPVRVDLRSYFPELQRGESLFVSAVSTAAHGNFLGSMLRIDNLCVSSDAGRDLEFAWQPPGDPSGIAGYAVVVDQNSNTQPAETVTQRESRHVRKDVKAGTWYIHVRAVNGAGKWSGTSHARAIVK